MMNYQAIGFTLFFILSLSTECLTKLFAQSNCDSNLTKLSNGPLSYKDRGDRCEGIYVKEVSSTTLQIVSLTESFGEYNTNSGKPILIEWDTPPATSVIHLKAQSVKRKLYYRMDTFRPNRDKLYNWPIDILASLNIEKSDFGIVGIAQASIGQEKRDIYIPLRLSQDGTVQINNYNLMLLPGVELKKVFISLALLGADGRPGKFIKDGEELKYGYYPAERSVQIPISGLKSEGIYYLEIGATLRNGGSSTLQILFYHSKEN
jgi:hypothetical protein